MGLFDDRSANLKKSHNYTIMHNFSGYPEDGSKPYRNLIFENNMLYGMTYCSGASNRGTAFSISADEIAEEYETTQMIIKKFKFKSNLLKKGEDAFDWKQSGMINFLFEIPR